jgi:hypothetical protein
LSQQHDIIPEGLPDHLPDGETLVWQGRPDWLQLAFHAFHVRKIAIYFAVVIAAQTAVGLSKGKAFQDAASAAPMVALFGAAACAILLLIAYVSAKTTHYTLTSKRALMKIGIALPVIINIPYRQVDGASFAVTSGTRGNIVFKTTEGTRLAYLLLWPHARPWNLKKPQPMLRDIANVEAVATRLANVIGARNVEDREPSSQMVPAE